MKNKIFGGIIVLMVIAIVIIYSAKPRVEKKPESNTEPKSATDSSKLNNEVIPAGLGAKPEQNLKDKSVRVVEEYIKSTAMNPSTFEFIEWSEVSPQDGYWGVRCKYKGISSFNAEVTTTAWFYIQNNKVVRTKVISKI